MNDAAGIGAGMLRIRRMICEQRSVSSAQRVGRFHGRRLIFYVNTGLKVACGKQEGELKRQILLARCVALSLWLFSIACTLISEPNGALRFFWVAVGNWACGFITGTAVYGAIVAYHVTKAGTTR